MGVPWGVAWWWGGAQALAQTACWWGLRAGEWSPGPWLAGGRPGSCRHCQPPLPAVGVNTCDIITLYISAIKALRVLDPSMVILEVACEPVRRYLR